MRFEEYIKKIKRNLPPNVYGRDNLISWMEHAYLIGFNEAICNIKDIAQAESDNIKLRN